MPESLDSIPTAAKRSSAKDPARAPLLATVLAPVLSLMLMLVGCSCGEAEQDLSSSDVAASVDVATPVVELKTVDPSTAGSLSGLVRYGPGDYAPEFREMSEAWCRMQHDGGGELDDRILVGANAALANAFVWVKSGLEGYKFAEPDGIVVVDQVGCLYTPRVQGATAGQPIEVRNSDKTMHNVNVKAARANRAMPPGSPPMQINIRRTPKMVEFKCDVHPWMKGWVCTVPHPIWAVTGDDGSYQLDGLPPGQFTLEVWHETLGTMLVEVEVLASQDTAVPEIALSP